jgi:hypothetical protein
VEELMRTDDRIAMNGSDRIQDAPDGVRRPDRVDPEGVRPSNGVGPYVALMERHREALRRDMLARITKRTTASQVRWSVASRATSTVALVLAMLFALATNASARPSGDRDDDVEEREDDERDAMDERGGVALELEADANTGATSGATGGPGLRRAPAIADVLEAAYDAAGLNHDPTRSWARRARVAGLIPWVTVKTGWDQSWHDDEPGDVGRSRTFEVRATWRLDRLLFEGRELQMSSIDTARRRERRRLASRVIRAYFVWRKVAPRGGLAAEAATAELDALTDGWFSERAKSGR